MSNIRRNFIPTSEEYLRQREAKRLELKETMPTDTDIKYFQNQFSRGEVRVIPWMESGAGSQSFTLRFSKEQSAHKLLNDLVNLFGKDIIQNETKSIVVVFTERKTKDEVAEKLKKLYVKVT